MNTSYLIGVDGGGSGCRVVVADAHGKIIANTHSGPANIASDFEQTLKNISEAIDAAWKMAKLDQSLLKTATCVLGLAGANTSRQTSELKNSLGFSNCQITDDRDITVAGALAGDDGCVAGLGTGSFYYGINQGVEVSIGGWGFLISDDGGGARLGQDLLRRVFHCHDGVLNHSELTRSILNAYNNSVQLLCEFVQQAKPSDLTKFVPVILEAAKAKDAHALALVEDSVMAIQMNLTHVGFLPERSLYMLGGLGTRITQFMQPQFQQAIDKPKGDALQGAISMAMLLAKTVSAKDKS